MKKQKDKDMMSEEFKMQKLVRNLKIVASMCFLIIISEAIFFTYTYFKREESNVHYNTYSAVDIINDNKIVVGFSDSKDGYQRANIEKLNSKGKIIWQSSYDEGFSSSFSSVKTVKDGYIAVGAVQMTEYQKNTNISEGLIVKYDLDGKLVWAKTYTVLSDTKFTKVLVEEDGYVVIGQSIYENLELGNHSTGGGVIVKYDFDGEVKWFNNYGGNKSGIYNDIVKCSDGYVVVGKDAKDTGITLLLDNLGKKVWVRNYSYTDGTGLQGVEILNDIIYAVGSKKIYKLTGNAEVDSQRNTDNTDALIIKYTVKGEMLSEKSFGGSGFEKYQDIVIDNNCLYLVGHITSTDTDLKVAAKNKEMTGLIVKTDLDGNILDKNIYGGANDDNLLSVLKMNDRFISVGYSNSKNKNHFNPLVIEFDNDLEISK